MENQQQQQPEASQSVHPVAEQQPSEKSAEHQGLIQLLIQLIKRAFAFDHFYYDLQQHWKRIFTIFGIVSVSLPAISMVINAGFDPCEKKDLVRVLNVSFNAILMIVAAIHSFIDPGSKRTDAEVAGDQYRNLSLDSAIEMKEGVFNTEDAARSKVRDMKLSMMFLRDRFEQPPISAMAEYLDRIEYDGTDINIESQYRRSQNSLHHRRQGKSVDDSPNIMVE